ncbi:MAG: type II secretion system protein [Phycisphaerae bacterium]
MNRSTVDVSAGPNPGAHRAARHRHTAFITLKADPASRSSPARTYAFTLLELLVVLAILAVLLGLLTPALSGARCEATKTTCLANMRALGQALATYGTDDEKGYTSPIHPRAETSWWYDGEYEYGGQTGIGVYAHPDFRKENRVLNRTIFGASGSFPTKLYQCPGDEGIPPAPVDFDPYFFGAGRYGKTVHEVTGTSYRLNNHIDFLHVTPFVTHFYGPYFRPRSRVPNSGETVILEEAVAEVAKWNAPNFVTRGWHCKPNRFNVSFVDGHADAIRIAGQSDLSETYPDYWVLRGADWRMDCYPDAPVLDKPRP